MELTYLLPLSIGLIVGYKSLGSNHDIAHLVAVFAFINLLVSLIIAPWEVQVILMIIVAFAVKLLWQKIDDKITSQELEGLENKNIKNDLQYRGVSYGSNQSKIALDKEEKTVKCYRGISYESSPPHAEETTDIPEKMIKYRGVHVSKKGTGL